MEAMDLKRLSKKRNYDLVCDSDDNFNEVFTGEMLQLLAQKGFCTVDMGFAQDFEVKACKEVNMIDDCGSLKRPADVLAAGLLGDMGSGRIASITEADLRSGSTFLEIDERITLLESLLKPWAFDTLGCDLATRSPLLLHEAGDEDGEQQALTEEQGLMWLNWFAYHRLMVIVFIGPSSGVLEMKPLLDDDAESFEVNVDPGMCVVLRADCLSHTFQAPTTSYALSSWFCEHAGLGPSQKRAKAGVFHLGHCRDLEDWLMDRFDVLLKKRDEELKGDYLAPIPRRVEMMLSRFFDRGSSLKSAIRSLAFDIPGYMDRDFFFTGLTAGCDIATELSNNRWDKSEYWDDDPEKDMVYSNHCGFCESIHLFDNKHFDLSPNEAKGMGPEQRKTCECSAQCFYEAGWTRKTMMKTLIGVYIGSPMSEYMFTGEVNGMGSDGSTLCGRVNFIFGLMGPTMTIDSEASSGLSTVYHGMNSLHASPKPMNDWAYCGGSYHTCTPMFWLFRCKLRWLTRMGRTFSYDENADGFCTGEGTGGFFIDRHTEEVDGKSVKKDLPMIGNLIHGTACNDGRAASLIAPNAPQLAEVHYRNAERSGISCLDIDAVECYGIGKLLSDSVEATATTKALRDANLYTIVDENVLCLGAHLSNQANSLHCSGTQGLVKAIMSVKWGMVMPTQHLRAMNPHIDFYEKPSVIGTESLEIKTEMAYYEVIGHGSGGTNVGVLIQGEAEAARGIAPPRFRMDASPLLFWPGGGGDLPEDSLPQRMYTLAGSWNDWGAPNHMQWEGEGLFGCTVTMGENCFEFFQIWLDGDSSKVLHPGIEGAPEGTAVLGPDEEVADGFSWMIDARDPDALEDPDGPGSWEAGNSGASAKVGKVGDRYRVYLHVCGKFRMVSWTKMPPR